MYSSSNTMNPEKKNLCWDIFFPFKKAPEVGGAQKYPQLSWCISNAQQFITWPYPQTEGRQNNALKHSQPPNAPALIPGT